MNLNRFIDYAHSKPIRVEGFEAHVQASAVQGLTTLLLVLQGRATHVRAVWAAFHQGALPGLGHHYPRNGEQAFVSPTPTVRLPQGIQMWVIHHDLTTAHCDHNAATFYTFGPPHFRAMMAATTAVPLLPEWEETVFSIGRRASLIHPLKGCYNTRLYVVDRNTEAWLEALSRHREELSHE